MSFREAAEKLKAMSEKAEAEARIAELVERYGRTLSTDMTIVEAYKVIAECLSEGLDDTGKK